MSRAPSIGTGLTSEEIKQDFRENLRCGLGRADRFATKYDQYYALALTVRDRVLQRTVESMETYGGANARRARFRVEDGILADVAPTLLFLLGLPQPVEMTGRNLLVLCRKDKK